MPNAGGIRIGAVALGALCFLAACSSDKESAAPDAAAPNDAAVADAALVDHAVSDTSPPEDAAPPEDANDASCGIGAPVQSEACSTCLVDSCCAETASCLGDAKCKSLDDCVNACLATNGGDAGTISACAQRCNAEAEAQVRLDWRAYNDCLNLKCVRNGAGPCQ